MYVHVCACGGQRLMLEIFLSSSLLYFMKHSLSLSLELTGSARLAGQQVPRILCTTSPSVEVTHTFHHTWLFLHRCVGGLDVGFSFTHFKHFTYWATAPGPRQLLSVILLLLKRVTVCRQAGLISRAPTLIIDMSDHLAEYYFLNVT